MGAHSCNAMLAGTCLGHDLLFAHLAAEQGLAQGVVDLVRACVVQVLPLQVDARLPAIRPVHTMTNALSCPAAADHDICWYLSNAVQCHGKARARQSLGPHAYHPAFRPFETGIPRCCFGAHPTSSEKCRGFFKVLPKGIDASAVKAANAYKPGTRILKIGVIESKPGSHNKPQPSQSQSRFIQQG